MQRRIIATLVLLQTATVPVLAADATCTLKTCPGKLVNPYEDGHYKFATSSRVYKSGRDFIFETCAQNNGINHLDFNWLIPGPDSWIPPGCAIPSRRPRQTSNQLNGQKGCLIYGNSGQTARIEFIPHETDKDLLSKEDDNCLLSSTADLDVQNGTQSLSTEANDNGHCLQGIYLLI
jgi:hypothetical protein